MKKTLHLNVCGHAALQTSERYSPDQGSHGRSAVPCSCGERAFNDPRNWRRELSTCTRRSLNHVMSNNSLNRCTMRKSRWCRVKSRRGQFFKKSHSSWAAFFTRNVVQSPRATLAWMKQTWRLSELVGKYPKCKGNVQVPLAEPESAVAEGSWTACQLERCVAAARPGIVRSMRVCLNERVFAAKTPQLR